MSIPNNLKQCRKACGLTQVTVAKKLDFHSSDRISKWEHGQMYPHVVNFLKLSVIYDKKPEELYPELLFNLKLEVTPKPVYSPVPSSSPEASYPGPLETFPHESDVL